MEIKVENNPKITLILNKREAEWLKAVMQNPLCGHGRTEEAEDNYMREKFWNSLSDLGI